MDNQTETTEGRTIRFEMTWSGAAQIIAAALENGTSTGRDAARTELFRMAEILDQLNAERRADEEAPSTPGMFYALAWIEDDGTPTRMQGDRIESDREEADRNAADWNDYLRSKGLPGKCAVFQMELDQ